MTYRRTIVIVPSEAGDVSIPIHVTARYRIFDEAKSSITPNKSTCFVKCIDGNTRIRIDYFALIQPNETPGSCLTTNSPRNTHTSNEPSIRYPARYPTNSTFSNDIDVPEMKGLHLPVFDMAKYADSRSARAVDRKPTYFVIVPMDRSCKRDRIRTRLPKRFPPGV